MHCCGRRRTNRPYLVALFLLAFVCSHVVVPQGYMLQSTGNGQWLILCTADGISKRFIGAVQGTDSAASETPAHQDAHAEHILCSLSAANAAVAAHTHYFAASATLQPCSAASSACRWQVHPYAHFSARAPPSLT